MKAVLFTMALGIGLAPLPGSADIKLDFGVYTSDKPTVMVKMFRPILNVLESELTKTLGEPTSISLQVASNYEKGIDNIASGRVDFARLGPASYVAAKHHSPNLGLLAMENVKGQKSFSGVICVKGKSDIDSVEQLRGRSFAFGDKRSTIGRYLSQHYLAQRGIRSSNLATFAYLGRHDAVGSAVGAGQFDAGALKESTFNKLRKKGVDIREIARFSNVTKPWVARAELDPKLVAALKAALLEMKDPNALKAIKKNGFFPAKDSDYATIRESIRDNKTFFETTATQQKT